MIRQIQTHVKTSVKNISDRILLATTDPNRETFAQIICSGVLVSLWDRRCEKIDLEWKIFEDGRPGKRPGPDQKIFVEELVLAVMELSPEQLGSTLGSLYSSLLPNEKRTQFGIYYTPQVLVDALLQNVSNQIFDFTKSKIFDPACGVGAFLISTVKKIRLGIQKKSQDYESAFVKAVSKNVSGYEIDPFAAWMAQVLIEMETLAECAKVRKRLPKLISVKDSLTASYSKSQKFDLVIGNPPYSKVSLPPDLRAKFSESLYGHANLYGIFTHLALQITKGNALIAYVTPTSFLSGQYFKVLRILLGKIAPPISIDFVSDRAGVFDGVLQETLLAVFAKGVKGTRKTAISELLSIEASMSIQKIEVGSYLIPDKSHLPWLFPRSIKQVKYIDAALKHEHRLSDYGYEVVTGQLVWNRHKDQLSTSSGRGKVPLIWAECVSPDGKFNHKAARKNHTPFFAIQPNQGFLLTNQECILVQRTTSKEQSRRLIAAVMPSDFVKKHKSGVVVENHINIIRPIKRTPGVSVKLLTALLNSVTLDNIFRCISGSVAVSAYELNNLPFPDPIETSSLKLLLKSERKKEILERKIESIFELIS